MATAVRNEWTHVLRSAKEYKAAVAEVDALLDADPARVTEAYDRLELLSVLIQVYEDEHDPIDDSASPQEVVEFMLEQHGLTRARLAPILGGRSRVSEFFSGKRALSLGQIAQLRELLGIPADLLISKPRGR
jgi:HTH-type transcriptional regulator/antitoxin HigA